MEQGSSINELRMIDTASADNTSSRRNILGGRNWVTLRIRRYLPTLRPYWRLYFTRWNDDFFLCMHTDKYASSRSESIEIRSSGEYDVLCGDLVGQPYTIIGQEEHMTIRIHSLSLYLQYDGFSTA